MRYLKNTLKILSGIALLIIIGLSGFRYYVKTHKAEIFSDFNDWYSINYNGSLTVDDIAVSTFENFPSVSLVIKNIAISDTINQLGKTKAIAINEIHLVVSFEKLMQKQIQFKALKIKKGSLKLLTDEIGNNNHQVFKAKKKDTSKNTSIVHWFSENGIKLQIEDVAISIIDHQKNKRITGKINDLNSEVFIENDQISANVEMDVFMNEMGLNLNNGTFFNGTVLTAELKPVFNKETKQLEIPFFDLKIDEQLFKVKASINTEGGGTFKFDLENEQTVAKPAIALLSQNIQKKLKSYNVTKPFYTYTTIEGSFEHGSNPLVRIQANTDKNSASIEDIHLKDLEFKGEFFNRIYKDERADTENKKDLTLHFDILNVTYKNIPFKLTNSSLLSTPKVNNYVDLNMEANAETVALNDLFNNKDFLFTKGNFYLKTAFKGDLLTPDKLFMATNTTLSLGNCELLYKPHSLVFPIDTLSIEVTKKDAFLNTLSIPIGNEGNSLQFSGDVLNATSLVFDNNDVVQTDINLTSNSVRWEDLMALFDNVKQENTDIKKNKRVISKVLKGIYKKFNPSLNIVIDKCHYYSFEAENLTTDVYFKGENELYFEKTGLNYQGGAINMKVFLSLEDAHHTGFNMTFDTEKLDFGSFLKEFNYFELKSLQEIEKLAGNITLDVDLDGVLDNQEGLDIKTLKGRAYFELNGVEVKGFEPLEKVADKIFKKERFEDIRFAPISNTIFIANETVEIPQMQMQSTAFDFFVEGHLNYDHKSNIWVSIPLSNLKHLDVSMIPELVDYENTGKKVYVEVKGSDDGKLDYKLHLNNKKLYEEKGILSQYKEQHKKEKASHKEYKKSKRKEKR